MLTSFKPFIENLIIESLHPELQSIVKSNDGDSDKLSKIAKTVRDITKRGESTGIESNMPHGSSRAYLQHTDPHEIELDGKKVKLTTGTKVAIHTPIEEFHDSKAWAGLSLGHLQNHAENGNPYINSQYRILHDNGNGKFDTNEEHGVLPPLFEHDYHNHEWSHVGHVHDISENDFEHLTKTPEHPNGIPHFMFSHAINRHFERARGNYWPTYQSMEHEIDKMENHPLVQKFKKYYSETDDLPYDLANIKNLGVFLHPNGKQHIIARDHGYSSDVRKAYSVAKRNQRETE